MFQGVGRGVESYQRLWEDVGGCGRAGGMI